MLALRLDMLKNSSRNKIIVTSKKTRTKDIQDILKEGPMSAEVFLEKIKVRERGVVRKAPIPRYHMVA